MFISIFIIVIKLIIPSFHRHFSNGFDFPLIPKGINITEYQKKINRQYIRGSGK